MVPVVSIGSVDAAVVVSVVSRGVCVGRLGETGGAFVGCVGGLVVTGGAFVGGFWAQSRCFVLLVVPAVSCGAGRASTVVPVVSRGVCVGWLGVTGGAFVGCVGGLVVTGGSFVGGFWAQLRCFVVSVVPAVSCGRARVLSVVPLVSCGRERVSTVVPVVSCGGECALSVVSVVSFGAGCWSVG